MVEEFKEKTYQCMCLRMFEIIAPIQRVKPSIEQESRPFTPLDNKAPWDQALLVLANYQVDIFFFQIAECLDDAIRWHDWHVFLHDRFQTLFIKDLRLEREGRVHNQGVLRKVEEVGAGWVLGHGIAHGGDDGP